MIYSLHRNASIFSLVREELVEDQGSRFNFYRFRSLIQRNDSRRTYSLYGEREREIERVSTRVSPRGLKCSEHRGHVDADSRETTVQLKHGVRPQCKFASGGRADLPTIFCQCTLPSLTLLSSISTVDENCLSLFYFVFFSFFEELPPPLRHRIRPISFPVDSLVVHASRRSFDLNGSRAESTYIGIIIETESGELVSGEGRIVRILCVVLCPHRSFSSSKFFKLNCFCFLSLSLFFDVSKEGFNRRKMLLSDSDFTPRKSKGKQFMTFGVCTRRASLKLRRNDIAVITPPGCFHSQHSPVQRLSRLLDKPRKLLVCKLFRPNPGLTLLHS